LNPETTIIRVKVKPNARTSTLEPMAQGGFVAHVRSPPTDGRANAELIVLVARYFGCPRVCVSIKSGAGSRMKRVAISNR
jgi:uncharacterized protein